MPASTLALAIPLGWRRDAVPHAAARAGNFEVEWRNQPTGQVSVSV